MRVGHVDKKHISFTFNGKSYSGYEGDTLAAALLANDVHLVGRSFKLHRPRGIMSAGVEEASAIVQLHPGTAYSKPNMRATEVYIYEGLVAESVNAWPNVSTDIKAINGCFAPLLVAGFYYKTFMWPKSFWHNVYEPMIRKMGGLGVCDRFDDPYTYERKDTHCDVLIVGSGPSGLAAAVEAVKHYQRVVLVESNRTLGETFSMERELMEGVSAEEWKNQAVAALEQHPNLTILTNTTLFGYYDHNYLCAVESLYNGFPKEGVPAQCIHHFRAKRVVLATGAIERPLVFMNNDLPGIMTASSVLRYLTGYQVACGQRVVLFTTNDSAYDVALTLHESGISIEAIVDVRESTQDVSLLSQVNEKNIPVYASSVVRKAVGKHHISSVQISSLSDESCAQPMIIPCDVLAVSGGWTPTVHLFSQSGGKLEYREDLSAFIPYIGTQSVVSIGASAGVYDVAICVKQGQLAAGKEPLNQSAFIPDIQSENSFYTVWDIPSGDPNDHGKYHYVDFMEDVSVQDIRLAAQEGFTSVELLKRYTTVGMGVDQGKTSNVNAIGLLSEALETSIPDVGTTKFRPPYTCVSFGAIAGPEVGNLLDPIRTTTIHEWHVEHGACFEDVGQWKRPWYFPKHGETMQETLNRECLAVRNSVGMLDASTLGKIDIQGKDAGKLLDLVYTNMFSTLPIGKCRYGVMCHEDGMVFDDGVTFRLDEHHYYMTTTTGGAASVLDWMEYWLQTEYPEWDVYLTSITEQYAAIVISGPKSREVLRTLCTGSDIDVSNEGIPFMSVQDVMIGDIPARIIRISFTGELAYEIHVPSYYGKAMWENVYEAGKPFDITPYGTETMHILRAEKGFIIAGQDTDGSVTPYDLEMDWVVSKKKDFLGKRTLLFESLTKPNRKRLVGLKTKQKHVVIPEGAQLVKDTRVPKPIPMEGHVTSSYFSAVLDRSIALALVKGGSSRLGETLYVPTENGVIEVEITSPVFYDPKGERQHV